MGSSNESESEQAISAAHRVYAKRELLLNNRALADARVQLTRLRREQNTLEQQFAEVNRASRQWLERVLGCDDHLDARAQAGVRQHRAAEMQISVLARRLEKHSALVQRQLRLISTLERRLQSALQRLRALDLQALEGHAAGVQDAAQSEERLATLSTLLEPWELREPQYPRQETAAVGVSEGDTGLGSDSGGQ